MERLLQGFHNPDHSDLEKQLGGSFLNEDDEEAADEEEEGKAWFLFSLTRSHRGSDIQAYFRSLSVAHDSVLLTGSNLLGALVVSGAKSLH